MSARIMRVQVDCTDPERLAAFWAEILGLEEIGRIGDGPQYLAIGRKGSDAVRLCFQRVPERKAGKNRLHLDVAVADMDEATLLVETLGGRRMGDFDEAGIRWRVMMDPEGNEFCLEAAG